MEAVEVGPFDTIMDAMVDSDGNPMGTGRLPGLHLGSIIKRIRQARGGKNAPEGWQDGASMYFGFLWEWAIELAFRVLGLLRPNSVKQLRLTKDGIHGTLDGVDFEDDNNTVLEEYKATWRTQKNVVVEGGDTMAPEVLRIALAQQLAANFPDWMIQMQGYLAMLSDYLEKPVTSARLFVFFTLGSYDRGQPPGPRVRVFELRFSEQEIADNWAMVLNVARELR